MTKKNRPSYRLPCDVLELYNLIGLSVQVMQQRDLERIRRQQELKKKKEQPEHT